MYLADYIFFLFINKSTSSKLLFMLPLLISNCALRAGSHFDISVSISINISIRKTCVNRDYISICISICISTRNGTFSIFLCLCLCFCCEYFSVNRAVHKHKHKHKSFLVSGIHKNTIQARSTNTKTKTWLRR